MPENDRHPREPDSGPGGGRLSPPDAETVVSVRTLIREEHRMSMRARTLSITLVSALRDYDAIKGTDDEAARIALRRAWCQHVLEMLQEVRTIAMRNRRAFDLIADHVKVGKSGTARFAAARKEFERHADQAEKTALKAIGESA